MCWTARPAALVVGFTTATTTLRPRVETRTSAAFSFAPHIQGPRLLNTHLPSCVIWLGGGSKHVVRCSHARLVWCHTARFITHKRIRGTWQGALRDVQPEFRHVTHATLERPRVAPELLAHTLKPGFFQHQAPLRTPARAAVCGTASTPDPASHRPPTVDAQLG